MGSVTLDRVDWNKVAPDRSSDICSFLDIHLPSISDNLVSCCDPMCKGSFMSNHALDLPLDSAPQKLSSLKQIREPCSTALLQVPPTPRIRWWIMINSTLFLLTETCELRSSQMALSLSLSLPSVTTPIPQLRRLNLTPTPTPISDPGPSGVGAPQDIV